MPYRPTDPDDSRHVVTAVLVTHDGARWLPEALQALQSQERPYQRLVVADTGSRDATPDILADAVGDDALVRLPRTAGFGAAVARAVSAVEPVDAGADVDGRPVVEWLWLLHDDCAPEPEALAELVEVAETSPSAAVLGPKIRGWYEPARLLEVGVTVTGSGRRETGLERGETDQGQHDGIREVMSVSTAGMLVRRDVFERLRGFDPSLPIFRDDLDFGWRVNLAGHRVLVVPDAVVHHAEAASLSRRRVACARSHRQLTDRRHALQVLLTNLPLTALPLAYVRLGVVSVLRVLGFVLSKRVGYAVDEAAALALVLLRPDRVLAARRRRRTGGALHHRAARHLLAPPRAQARHVFEVVAGVLAGRGDALERPALRETRESLETGPSTDEVENLALTSGDGLRRLLGRPGLLLFAGLLLVTVAAARHLLFGGTLMGGALLPTPGGAGDLWQAYTASWHEVGLGDSGPAPPYLAVLALLSTVLLGKPGVAVTLLLVGAVPLAGWSAYRASAELVESSVIRVWAAAAYALLPVATGAVATGRLGTVVALVLLPPLATLGVRTLGISRPPASHTPWAAGAVLAVVSAFVPLAYLTAAALGVLALLVLRTGTAARRLAVVLAVPPLVLLPWTLTAVRHPSQLLLQAGLPGPGLADPTVNPVALVLLHPGGPGMYRTVLTVGLVAAALAALLRPDRREVVLGAWGVALAGLVLAFVVARVHVTAPSGQLAVAVWPGLPVAVVGLALLVAAAVGADGFRGRVGSRTFGWRQPAGVVLAVVAGLTPVLAAVAWVARGADGPVERSDADILPAYVAADADTPARPRTLVLQRHDNGSVSFSLVRDTGPRLGAAETGAGSGTFRGLDRLVADVLSGRGGGAEVARLSSFAVRYVLVNGSVDPQTLQTLDAVPGLDRVSTESGSTLWKLQGSPSRLRLVDGRGQGGGPAGTAGTPVPSGPVGSSTRVPQGHGPRTLVLAERADPGWQATLDGRPLHPVTVHGWAQGFAVPASGGRLVLGHDTTGTVRWTVAQAVLVLVALVMALPGARTEDDRDSAAVAETPSTPSRPAAGERRAPPGRRGGRGGRRKGRRGRKAGRPAVAGRPRRRT